MSWASGISPITTSTSDLPVGGASLSTARPDSPAEIDPSRSAVLRSSPVDASSIALLTSAEREVGAAPSGDGGSSREFESSSEVLETVVVRMEEHYPKRRN